jgi:hypothetical protein
MFSSKSTPLTPWPTHLWPPSSHLLLPRSPWFHDMVWVWREGACEGHYSYRVRAESASVPWSCPQAEGVCKVRGTADSHPLSYTCRKPSPPPPPTLFFIPAVNGVLLRSSLSYWRVRPPTALVTSSVAFFFQRCVRLFFLSVCIINT